MQFGRTAIAGVVSSNEVSGRTTPRGAYRPRLSAIGAIVQRAFRALRTWVTVPVLPYATLWEAAIVARVLTSGEFFEPDGSVTEAPFLTDSWPRG